MAKPSGAVLRFDPIVGGAGFEIAQRLDSGVTGCGVWGAGVVLPFWLARNAHVVRGKHVIELGAGCGQAGIAAAILGARSVVLTDQPEVLDHLASNVKRNNAAASAAGCSSFHAAPLVWSSTPSELAVPPEIATHQHWQVVLVADCCYSASMVAPLLNTILTLMQTHGVEVAIVSHDDRDESATAMLRSEMDRLFDVTEVSTSRVVKCLPTDSDVRLRSDGAPVSLRMEPTMQLYILRRPDHLRA
jgi:predicted nicotinamide N-methyase